MLENHLAGGVVRVQVAPRDADRARLWTLKDELRLERSGGGGAEVGHGGERDDEAVGGGAARGDSHHACVSGVRGGLLRGVLLLNVASLE